MTPVMAATPVSPVTAAGSPAGSAPAKYVSNAGRRAGSIGGGSPCVPMIHRSAPSDAIHTTSSTTGAQLLRCCTPSTGTSEPPMRTLQVEPSTAVTTPCRIRKPARALRASASSFI